MVRPVSSTQAHALALGVNVSNFVSVKLSGSYNYKIWMTQMEGLIKSVALDYVIKETPTSEGVDKLNDLLVRGWIFGSMHVELLKDFIEMESAKEVWDKLGELNNLHIEIQKAEVKENAAAMTEAIGTFPETLKSKTVTELNGCDNYKTWKESIMKHIKGMKLLHIIDADHPVPSDVDDSIIKQYDNHLNKWIVKYINKNLKKHFEESPSTQCLLMRLEFIFNDPKTK